MKRLIKLKFLEPYLTIYKNDGFKGVLKKGGWKAAVYLFLFFLIKGLLWLIIPYVMYSGVS